MHESVEQGRRAFARQAWADAYNALSRVEKPLDPDDLERLAIAAGVTGHDTAAIEAFEQLHQLRLDAGDVPRAARAAFWAALRALSLGETARGGGWLAKAQRLVDNLGHDCVEQGYLRLPLVIRLLAGRDFTAASQTAAEAAAIGDRYHDRDLSALARDFEGRALIRQGRVSEGLGLLDEAMVETTRGGLSPVVSGLIYCDAIAACHQIYAIDRAREWTAALTHWCQSQPQLVAFAGTCLIHRAQIMQIGGTWTEALDEAHRAVSRLEHRRGTDAGHAYYQEAELHRLRGQVSDAERTYALASERGRDPQPGLALLWLAQGRVDAAAAAIRRVLSVTPDSIERARFLPAHVEIMLAADDLSAARDAANELRTLADALQMPMLDAMAEHAGGLVALAEGDSSGAIDRLRRAQNEWLRLGAPYLGARVRVVIARALRDVGDTASAGLELETARKIFLELNAAPDLAAFDAASAVPATGRQAHGLSARELEVLRLLAAGKTNKAIAGELFVSERTVDRHVSNIFVKLDVSTRAAATAQAFQRGLVE